MRAIVAVLLWFATAAWAADPGAERERIRAETEAADAAYAAAQRECADRFAVSACVEAARRQRADKLQLLRQQQALLDEAQRRDRAAQRIAQIRDKISAAEQRDRASPATPAPPMRVVTRSPAASAAAASRPADGAGAVERRRIEEQRHRAEFAERQRQLQEHREAAERRAEQRRQAGRRAAPLPASAPR